MGWRLRPNSFADLQRVRAIGRFFYRAKKEHSYGLLLLPAFITAFFAITYTAIISVLTTNEALIGFTHHYAFWAIITPITGVMAFHYDGVFIGSSWTKDMRKMMVWSFVAFAITAIILAMILDNHGLWIALNISSCERNSIAIAHGTNLISTFP